MNKQTLDEIRARVAAATAGPWEWYGNTKHGSCYLATQDGGRVFVMQLDRWKMSGAQPTFQLRFETGDGYMCKLSEMTDPPDGLPTGMGPKYKAPHRKDFVGIGHPDAAFIAHSRQDVDDLLEYVRLLQEQNDAMKRLIEAMKEKLAQIAPDKNWVSIMKEINDACARHVSADHEAT